MKEQVLKVLGKLEEQKYPEYNLGNTRTAKLNVCLNKLGPCLSMPFNS